MRDTRALETGSKARERQPSEPGTAPRSPDAQELLELQRTVGNAAVARLIAATPAPRRLAREEEAPEEKAAPLDEMAAAGGSYTLSLAGIGDGLAIESFSLRPPERGGSEEGSKSTQASVARRLDKYSVTIQQAAATGKPIASAEIKARGRSGTLSLKMQNVLVASYSVGSGGENEDFTLDFTELSVEQT